MNLVESTAVCLCVRLRVCVLYDFKAGDFFLQKKINNIPRF